MGLILLMPNGDRPGFTGITSDLGAALAAGGKPLRPDGSFYVLSTFLGGYLLDGCPLNIIFGQGWLPAQIDALKQANITPQCLVPGTQDYFQFYGTAGIAPSAPALPGPSPIPATLPIASGFQPIPVATGSAPPTVQVTEQPYVPPLGQGPGEVPGPAPFGMDWTTIIIVGLVAYFLLRRS